MQTEKYMLTYTNTHWQAGRHAETGRQAVRSKQSKRHEVRRTTQTDKQADRET